MENYELAQQVLIHCDNDTVMRMPEDDHVANITDAMDSLEQTNPAAFSLLKGYLENAMKTTTVIKNRVCDDLMKLIDNECEVFDPICDGPVEHAEGMVIARDLVEKYKDGKIERRFLERD